MSETIDALLHDMLDSLARGQRPYAEMLEAWRTSCPRLPVWEEANDRGLVARVRTEQGSAVALTAAGRAFLASRATAQSRQA